jgi:hypothetical protein
MKVMGALAAIAAPTKRSIESLIAGTSSAPALATNIGIIEDASAGMQKIGEKAITDAGDSFSVCAADSWQSKSA